ncbi:MAG TPA: tRNA pseudouridine(55) synthase TruB [Candidatus Babeliales bacterium]|jgi:tRNA pseudouridine55 synthase|nr:tRNA pseudouridine(55) synthase TruB [Candidatus Babeliales bacterium]
MENVINPGFLLINKPTGISSYGCIGYLKRILKQKIKIGHAGTLDPFASGLIIVALGREATRLIFHIMVMEKTYVATGKCGELTDTLDHTGTVLTTSEVIPSEQEIRTSLESFGTSYEQIPPLYSALKHQGYPLYALARQNMMNKEQLQEIAENKRRTVQLYDVQLVSYESPFFTIQTRVSHGTYIRTLINDIAMRANSCATTYQLVRTAIGPFDLSQAVDLTSINTIDDINRLILSVARLHLFKPL